MGELIKRIAIFVGEKGSKIDPADFMTQDTVHAFLEIAKELVKP